MFSKDQLSASLRTTDLFTPALRATVIMDQEQLNSDILSALPDDPLYKAQLADSQDRWSVTPEGFLRYDNLIYVPDTNDLRLRILRYKHDHILSGHPGQNKTAELIRREYTWPGLREFTKKYIKSCTTCMRAKPKRHKPYGFLKQLPIPERTWYSISMDFIETLPTSSGSDSILVIVDRLTYSNYHSLHLRRPSNDVRHSRVFQTRSPGTCYLRSRIGIHLPLFPLSWKST